MGKLVQLLGENLQSTARLVEHIRSRSSQDVLHLPLRKKPKSLTFCVIGGDAAPFLNRFKSHRVGGGAIPLSAGASSM